MNLTEGFIFQLFVEELIQQKRGINSNWVSQQSRKLYQSNLDFEQKAPKLTPELMAQLKQNVVVLTKKD